MKKRGFTLIELLVVIAIISLLLAIVVPALRKARASARFLVCKTNLRSLVTAMNSYTVDNKGQFIPYSGWTGASPNRSLWIDAVSKYVSDVSDVRLCPEAKVTEPEEIPVTDNKSHEGSATRAWSVYTPVTESPYAKNNHSTGSYALNGFFYTTNGVPQRDKEWLAAYAGNLDYLFNTVSSVSQPATIPVLMDGVYPDVWPRPGELPHAKFEWSTGYVDLGSQEYSMSRMLIDRHGKKLAVGFLDGHADQTEIIKDLELWSLRWRKGWTAPTSTQAASITTALLNKRR